MTKRDKNLDAADRASAEGSSPNFIRAIARGLSVLEVLGRRSTGITSSDVAAAANLDRATARRVLLTLQELKYVRVDEDRYYLTSGVLKFGYGFLSSLPFWDLIRPMMEQLVDTIHESSSAAILEESHAVYVARVRCTDRVVDVARTIGSHVPAYCTSLGRVLLAGLPPQQRKAILMQAKLEKYTEFTIVDPRRLEQILEDIENQGWALVDQELELGLRSLAVPLHDAKGVVTGALNVSTQVQRASIEHLMEHILPELKKTAAEIDMASLARA